MSQATPWIRVPNTGDWEPHPGNPEILTGWARVQRGPRELLERVMVTVVRQLAHSRMDMSFTATAYLAFSGGVIARHSGPHLDPAPAVQEVLDAIRYGTTEIEPETVMEPFPPGTVETTRATPPVATCENCRFWRTRGGSHPPECRKHPPVTVDNGDSVWPAVTKRDWCGEHEPRERP